ncbi:MAG TPA: YwiC-like family protein [Acidimicrobiia bacterium]|nr:YwiC-like family protein [Acidimicrobiia bacterium]
MSVDVARPEDAGLPPARPGRQAPSARSPWRAVAVPDEHGGWGLTAEPVLLGLLVAPSRAGAFLAVGALLAFVVRTPLKLVLVDHRRHRRLPRSRLAARVAGAELTVLAGAATVATVLAGWDWWIPVAGAAPLVGVELWFDMRSRSRRLLPELCGAVGIAAAGASVALAGGAGARLAVALWLVLAARAVASIPFVRLQVRRLHRGTVRTAPGDLAQGAGAAVAIAAVLVDGAVTAGAGAIAALALLQVLWARRPAIAAKTLGLRQMAAGFAVVAVTAAGVLAT